MRGSVFLYVVACFGINHNIKKNIFKFVLYFFGKFAIIE